jgi:hypothetical protein
MGFVDPGPESPLFYVGLASLNTVPLVPKYDFFGQQLGGVDLNDDKILNVTSFPEIPLLDNPPNVLLIALLLVHPPP